jgi:hypothetical protein
VERNEIVFYIFRMVWAEVVLKKKVDWRTIKQAKNITMPEEQDIPMGMLGFFHGGLNLSKGPIGKVEEEDDTEESEEDNDSNGTRATKVNTTPGPKRALKALRDKKQAWLHKGQPSAPFKGASDVPAIVAIPTSGWEWHRAHYDNWSSQHRAQYSYPEQAKFTACRGLQIIVLS